MVVAGPKNRGCTRSRQVRWYGSLVWHRAGIHTDEACWVDPLPPSLPGQGQFLISFCGFTIENVPAVLGILAVIWLGVSSFCFWSDDMLKPKDGLKTRVNSMFRYVPLMRSHRAGQGRLVKSQRCHWVSWCHGGWSTNGYNQDGLMW